MPVADQSPIDSPFGHSTIARDVVEGLDLSGVRAVITGGYSGIGLEAARALALVGAEVIAAGRSRKKAERALAEIDGQVSFADLDLCDLASIQAFADAQIEAGRPIDLLINNAGIMACPEQRTEQGWEAQFGANHLGHFALTLRLLPLLRTAPSARIVALSSLAHIISDIDFDDPNFERRDYEKWTAYGQSKTANALFAAGAAERLADDGILAFSLHPGGIMTDLQRDLSDEEMRAMGWMDDDGTLADGFKTKEQGAATTVFAATSDLIAGHSGAYLEDCNIAPLTEAKARHGVREYAVDSDRATRLWMLSERMTGLAL